MTDDATIQGLMAPWDCGPIEIERKAVYRFHGLMANRWRDRRALIAGDAAHQTPPFAGQGMCSGIRDAVNLAWKLAAVISGGAGEALVDSYQLEREPHVRAAIELAIGMGRVVCTSDPQAAAARDARMLAQREGGVPVLPPITAASFAAGCILAGAPGAGSLFPQPIHGEGPGRVRMDDVLGAGPWLIARSSAAVWNATVEVFVLTADYLAPFRSALTAWLDSHDAEAVLIRPDRYVFGAGPAATLLAAWSKALE
jgi:3-(3-hydroxy-phenyl)propionate hydroxylase